MATVTKIEVKPVTPPVRINLDMSEAEAQALRKQLADKSPGLLYGVWDALDDVLRCGEDKATHNSSSDDE